MSFPYCKYPLGLESYLQVSENKKKEPADCPLIPEENIPHSLYTSKPMIHVIFDLQRNENTTAEIAEMALDYKEYFFSDLKNESGKKRKEEKKDDRVFCLYDEVDWDKILILKT